MDPGDTVPDFTATTHDGGSLRLSELTARGPVVLFFYPKAFTGGCTAELCHFRDLSDQFAALDATPVGVSRDDPEQQASFRSEHGFSGPLIADEDGSVAELFDAKRPGPLWSRRHTFVIGADHELLGAVRSETDMELHADRALGILREQSD